MKYFKDNYKNYNYYSIMSTKSNDNQDRLGDFLLKNWPYV